MQSQKQGFVKNNEHDAEQSTSSKVSRCKRWLQHGADQDCAHARKANVMEI
jgi:hypothetical protein